MKIYDISQELFTCTVFPGDPAPEKQTVLRISNGDICNLTALSMCAHNGTHLDAPYHFIDGGDTVDKLDLSKTVGYAYVHTCHEEITAQDADMIYVKAQNDFPESAKRILIRGKGFISAEAAQLLADRGVELVGTEYQSVGPEGKPVAVHTALLSAKVVLLEGLRLDDVSDGVYFLCAQPINLGGCDGAPCRAILLGEDKTKLFLHFDSNEERRKYGGSAFIELQYFRMHERTLKSKLVDVDKIVNWRNDSLYVYDCTAFLRAYSDIFCDGLYNNGKNGPLDLFGINYYSNSQISEIIKRIESIAPADSQTLLDWLRAGRAYNGIYILGI